MCEVATLTPRTQPGTSTQKELICSILLAYRFNPRFHAAKLQSTLSTRYFCSRVSPFTPHLRDRETCSSPSGWSRGKAPAAGPHDPPDPSTRTCRSQPDNLWAGPHQGPPQCATEKTSYV
ncbi:hypothetical protein ATANTOWER_001049 [Ataeniobius toweri]|uniref:Uncharacterized protein n=1 Tax=Ataeniobius toweri TaxID=208326 RepID=A0ABU7A3W9_9TELE|nr:hypothetical protein [Ataeniobius toweri]